MMINFSKPVLLLAAIAFFFASCQPDPEPEPIVVKAYGKIQVFHAAIDAPAIDFQVDGAKINADSLSYSKGTPYYSALLTTGKKNVFKTIIAKTAQVISTDSLAMNEGDVGYSVFVYQDKDAAKTVRTLSTPDNLIAPTSGKGKVRFVHLIPDANVNIDVEAVASGGIASANNTFPNLAFPKIADYVELAPGTYDLKIKVSGTTNTILNVTGVVVESGKIYSLVARGYSQLANKSGVTIITNK
jgi:Domain of unknown function (DUF4397)